jgi:2-oxoglutarate ferredoxin oxidoreductase subunit gamma
VERIDIRANDIAEQLGDIRIANMVMLGAFLRKTGVVALGSVLDALKAVLPPRRHSLLSVNEKALQCGGEVCA